MDGKKIENPNEVCGFGSGWRYYDLSADMDGRSII